LNTGTWAESFCLLSASLVVRATDPAARTEEAEMAGGFLVKNVGSVDRALRVVLGLGLLSMTVFGPQTMWGLIGIVPLFTGLVGTCPAYSLLGLSTCPVSSR